MSVHETAVAIRADEQDMARDSRSLGRCVTQRTTGRVAVLAFWLAIGNLGIADAQVPSPRYADPFYFHVWGYGGNAFDACSPGNEYWVRALEERGVWNLPATVASISLSNPLAPGFVNARFDYANGRLEASALGSTGGYNIFGGAGCRRHSRFAVVVEGWDDVTFAGIGAASEVVQFRSSVYEALWVTTPANTTRFSSEPTGDPIYPWAVSVQVQRSQPTVRVHFAMGQAAGSAGEAAPDQTGWVPVTLFPSSYAETQLFTMGPLRQGVVCTSASGAFPGCVPALYDPAVDMLDPMTLSASQLGAGSCPITSSSPVVAGAAADGVSMVLLRIHARTAGEVFTVGLPAGGGNEPGWLGPLGSSGSGSIVTTTANCPDSNGGYLAYAVYRAPLDFAWNAAQQSLARRTVQIIAQSPASNQVAVNVEIVRPPVVLVHGFGTDATETWRDFAPFNRPQTSTHQVFEIDYGGPISSEGWVVTSLSPASTQSSPPIRQSELGIAANFGRVAWGVHQSVRDFASGINPLGQPVAAVQADVVAHSMGGLLVRYWALQAQFKIQPWTYGQGYVHKLITIGTPHLGSPQAILSLEPAASCSRSVAALFGGRFIFRSASLLHSATGVVAAVPGAVQDLMGDGVGGYQEGAALQAIVRGHGGLRIAALAGDITPIEDRMSALRVLAYDSCGFLAGDPLARRYAPGNVGTMFDPTIRPGNLGTGVPRPSDGAVPLTSALLDPTTLTCVSPICFSGKPHGEGTSRFFFDYALPHLVDASRGVALRVQTLLNTPPTTSVWRSW